MGTPPYTYLGTLNTKIMGPYILLKLDAKQGWWNVKLDVALSPISTFYTPFGSDKYLRIPFGLRMSQDHLPKED